MESRKPILLVDLDNVLAQFNKLCCLRWRDKYPDRPSVEHENLQHHYIERDYEALGAGYGNDMREIWHADGFTEALEPMEGAVEAMAELQRDYIVFICSAAGDPKRIAAKVAWSTHLFGGQWTERQITLSRDKTLVRGDWLIDDNPQIQGLVQPPFFEDILYDQPYNRAVTDKKRLTWSHWRQVLQSLQPPGQSLPPRHIAAKIVLIDLDDVLTDLSGTCTKLWREWYPDLPYVEPEKRQYHYIDDDYEALRPGLGEKMRELRHADDFYNHVRPMEGAVEALNEMQRAGYNVFVCTTPSRSVKRLYNKTQWVGRELGPQWTDRLILTPDKTLIHGSVRIDDAPRIKGLLEPSFTHVLYNQPHNRHCAQSRRVDWFDWKRILYSLI
jgi:5'-nucleotidase